MRNTIPSSETQLRTKGSRASIQRSLWSYAVVEMGRGGYIVCIVYWLGVVHTILIVPNMFHDYFIFAKPTKSDVKTGWYMSKSLGYNTFNKKHVAKSLPGADDHQSVVIIKIQCLDVYLVYQEKSPSSRFIGSFGPPWARQTSDTTCLPLLTPPRRSSMDTWLSWSTVRTWKTCKWQTALLTGLSVKDWDLQHLGYTCQQHIDGNTWQPK